MQLYCLLTCISVLILVQTPAKSSGSSAKQTEIIILDTPEEKEKTIKSAVSNDFREKALPTVSHRRHIHSLAQQADDDVEIDHLEITAPQPSDAAKKNAKGKSLKDSPNKGKQVGLLKDRRAHKGSPREIDMNRKRSHELNEERRSYSDPDTKHHRSKREDKIDDLRSHLLKKEVAKKRGSDVGGRDEPRGGGREERGREERDEPRGGAAATNRDDRGDERKKERENEDKKSAEKHSRREYERYRESTTKEKKKKKSKRKESRDGKEERRERKRDEEEVEEVEHMELEKSPPVLKKDENISYDDITSSSSEPSPAPLAKSPQSTSGESEPKESAPPSPLSKSPIVLAKETSRSRSPSRSPSRSRSPSPGSPAVVRSPSRSPTPERSPTPVRKRTYFPAIEGCRNVKEFVWLNRIEEGTYGVVYRAKDRMAGILQYLSLRSVFFGLSSL